MDKPLYEDIFWGMPDGQHLLRVAVRLGVAALLGGWLGLEREMVGKKAGMRTHMLVAVGSALLTLFAAEAGFRTADLSRVIQGVVTGIGFLGGGTILKLTKQQEVRGLTTAAGVWLTAAIGLAIGLGALWPALLSAALGWFILAWLDDIERWLRQRYPRKE